MKQFIVEVASIVPNVGVTIDKVEVKARDKNHAKDKVLGMEKFKFPKFSRKGKIKGYRTIKQFTWPYLLPNGYTRRIVDCYAA
jgi:hypothetical protein